MEPKTVSQLGRSLPSPGPTHGSLGWNLGQLLQGLVLGVLLYLAVAQLMLETGERLFRYQGF